ncbi:MAG: exodeoxyribonuclease III [Candidatus Melainabacteria bacterium]|nr:exodeoxyribonuclease III [Candidatus Melainabacteria bacterium]
MSALLRLYSWNVNGLRAVLKKGFSDWLEATQPDILGLQETKISADQLTPEMTHPAGYHTYWSHATRRGYSGVAVLCKQEPLSVQQGFGNELFDCEGRTLRLEFPDFVLYNIYFPNGTRDDIRLNYKMDFYRAFLAHLQEQIALGKKVIVCGDVNTAHREVDLARPKDNENVSGFLPIERAWMDELLSNGFIDTFRHCHPDATDCYTWWHMRTRARERNVGWRIDYFLAHQQLLPHIAEAHIHPDVQGSDHCPVSLALAL